MLVTPDLPHAALPCHTACQGWPVLLQQQAVASGGSEPGWWAPTSGQARSGASFKPSVPHRELCPPASQCAPTDLGAGLPVGLAKQNFWTNNRAPRPWPPALQGAGVRGELPRVHQSLPACPGPSPPCSARLGLGAPLSALSTVAQAGPETPVSLSCHLGSAAQSIFVPGWTSGAAAPPWPLITPWPGPRPSWPCKCPGPP